jgi:transposase
MPFIPVGVDIAKKKFDVAGLFNGKYRHKVFPNTPEGFADLIHWLSGFGGPAQLRIALEATGAYSLPLAEFLADQGFWISVVNPAKIQAFAKSELSRAKTDKADAKLIVRYVQEKQPPRWNPPPPAIRQLQALLRRVEQLQELQQMERNRLDTADAAVKGSIQTLIEIMDREIKALREQIRRHIDDDPDLRQRRDWLDTIPGLGEATTAHFLVLFSPHYGFLNAKQVAAFIGLNPHLRESGQWKGQTRLSKIGDPLFRKILYMPALVAWRYNPVIRAFCERLKANGKNGKAIACAAMRKLIHIAFGVLKSGQPFNPNLALA